MAKWYGLKENFLTEDGLFKLLLVVLLFLLLMFNPEMGMIYLLMVIADYIWWHLDDNVTLPIERTSNNRTFSFLVSLAIYAGFLLVTAFVTSILGKQTLGVRPIESIVALLATTTPVLAESKILTFFAWGIIIPIIETRFFFGRLLEGIIAHGSEIARIKIPHFFKMTSLSLWVVVLFNGFLFALFHLTAKGIENSTALMITAIFAVISCWVVLYFRQTREAVIFHIISNSIAVSYTLGIKILAFVGA